jgi:putative DNA primase/helicase
VITSAQAAQAYARFGRRVFPLAIGGKEPKIAGGRGVLDATSDPKQIAEWWKRWPAANIGLAIEPHELVIDLDVRRDGVERFRALEQKYGAVERTPTQRTATGGLHLFVWRPDIALRKSLIDGIDLLCGNKYVVTAPSFRDGNYYEFTTPLSRTPLAKCPTWLVEAAKREEQLPITPRPLGPTPTIDRVRAYIERMPAAISGQGGHPATFAVACVIAANVSDFDEQFALLAEYNQRCKPPWSKRELEHKLDDARKRDLRPLADRQRSERAA